MLMGLSLANLSSGSNSKAVQNVATNNACFTCQPTKTSGWPRDPCVAGPASSPCTSPPEPLYGGAQRIKPGGLPLRTRFKVFWKCIGVQPMDASDAPHGSCPCKQPNAKAQVHRPISSTFGQGLAGRSVALHRFANSTGYWRARCAIPVHPGEPLAQLKRLCQVLTPGDVPMNPHSALHGLVATAALAAGLAHGPWPTPRHPVKTPWC